MNLAQELNGIRSVSVSHVLCAGSVSVAIANRQIQSENARAGDGQPHECDDSRERPAQFTTAPKQYGRSIPEQAISCADPEGNGKCGAILNAVTERHMPAEEIPSRSCEQAGADRHNLERCDGDTPTQAVNASLVGGDRSNANAVIHRDKVTVKAIKSGDHPNGAEAPLLKASLSGPLESDRCSILLTQDQHGRTCQRSKLNRAKPAHAERVATPSGSKKETTASMYQAMHPAPIPQPTLRCQLCTNWKRPGELVRGLCHQCLREFYS